MITSQECICWGHFGSRSDLPLQIKVLQEKRPSGLLSGQFFGVFDVGEILVISDNGDRVCGSLEILIFFQG